MHFRIHAITLKIMTNKKQVTKSELLADAQALLAKIKEVPNYDKDIDLLYASREAGNLISWLKK